MRARRRRLRPRVRSPDGALESLNGAGAVPRALATVEIPGGTLPRFGPLSVSTPGLVDAWWRLWERYGTRSFSVLLEPAAELADRGFELDEAFAHALSKTRAGVGHQDPFYAEFCDGNGVAAGEHFRLPSLAGTLRQIGSHGPEILYSGPLGKAVVDTVVARGGLLSEADFSNHCRRFRGAHHCPLRLSTGLGDAAGVDGLGAVAADAAV